MVDRLGRQLALSEVELVVSPRVKATRVLVQDVPWIVVPASLVEMPESTQLASIARALARIAFGVPWLQELQPSNVEALLVAAARQVVPSYGRGGKAVAGYDSALARAITRRQRRLLEELAAHLSAGAGAPPPIEELVDALLRGELRATFVLTGDLLAVVDEVGLTDPALRAAASKPGRAALVTCLEHPWVGDVVRFALTPETTVLRRRVGSTWSPPPR